MIFGREKVIPCATPDGAAINPEAFPLPDAYMFSPVLALSRACELMSENVSPRKWLAGHNQTTQLRGGCFQYVAVENRDTNQVVAAGSIHHHDVAAFGPKQTFAGFYDLFVDPEHRGLGLAKRIIDFRMALAAVATQNIYVPRIEDTNTLETYYRLQHGMRVGPGDPDLYRGQLPILIRANQF